MIDGWKNVKNRMKTNITTIAKSQPQKPTGIAKISFFCQSWEEMIIHGSPFFKELIDLVVKEGNIFLT